MAPGAVLLAGPLLLGVPHIFAELRVFTRQIRLPRPLLLAVAAPLGLLILLRVFEALGLERPANSDVVLGCTALCLAAMLRSGNVTQRCGRGLVVLGLSIVALHDPKLTTLVLAHGHNFIALAFLALWIHPKQSMRPAHTIIAAAVVAMLLLVTLATPADIGFLREIRLALAPGVEAEWGVRIVLIYAFAQLLHYAVWLWWLPALAREPLPDRQPLRGSRWLMIVGALAVLPILAVLSGNAIAVRETYLALSSFHGWLELSVLAAVGWRSHAH